MLQGCPYFALQNCLGRSQSPVEMELTEAESSDKISAFQSARSEVLSQLNKEKGSIRFAFNSEMK